MAVAINVCLCYNAGSQTANAREGWQLSRLRLGAYVLPVLFLMAFSLSLGPLSSERPVVVASAPPPPGPAAVGPEEDPPAFPSANGIVAGETAFFEPAQQTQFPRRGWHAIPRQRLRVPILMYHYVRVNPNPADRMGFGLSVPPADLDAQLGFFAQRGYQAASLEDVVDFLSGRLEAPPAPGSFVLTFDDGYRDNYEAAFPLLKKYHFTATVFVISGFVGRLGYLTWPQLRELADDGITIGAHTIDHPDLTVIGAAAVKRELVESKAVLEAGLGRPVRLLAYPSGRYNEQVVAAAKATGYEGAVTVNYGLVHAPDDRFTLTRVRVSGGQSIASLAVSAGLTLPPASTLYPASNLRPIGGPSAD